MWLADAIYAGFEVRCELEELPHPLRFGCDAEVGKQSQKTLLDVFERYIQGYMTLFDTI